MEYIKRPTGQSRKQLGEIQKATHQIIQMVMRNGLDAVKKLTAQLDRYDGPLRVDLQLIEQCRDALSPQSRQALEQAAANIWKFHENQKQLLQDSQWPLSLGVTAGIRFSPVERVAVYVPGGRYPLPSTVLMGVIPAMVAGVDRIAILSPPRSETGIHPVVLGAIGMLGVQEVWAIGGAQGIAAMALGAGDMAPVDMIVGPGNAYVTEAKRYFYGKIGIDGLAGPSEVLILADQSASAEALAADLLAQAEHDPLASSMLVTVDRELATAVVAAVDRQLATLPTANVAAPAWRHNGVVAVGSMDEAIDYANAMAPEHLELAVAHPRAWLDRCRHYGAAFLGHQTCVAFGDFITGTNHILPTAGAARFSSGVWVGTFLKAMTHQQFTADALSDLAPHGIQMAEAEGLASHAQSMRCRQEVDHV